MVVIGTDASREVLHTLERNGYEAFYVGGVVRDALFGKTSDDIDITTSATPQEIQTLFQKTFNVGIDHGTVLIRHKGKSFEVTTYRTGFLHGDVPVEKHTLKHDVQKRDFTINALAATVDGDIVDLVGGVVDIERKCIQAVGVPQERFIEDPLRILRALRFMSTLQFQIESNTLQAMKKQSFQLNNVSRERIKVELEKLLMGSGAPKALRLCVQLGLNQIIRCFPSSVKMIIGLHPFDHTKEGWAIFWIASGQSVHEFSQAYSLSNDEKQYIKQVEEVYALRQKGSLTQQMFYTYDAQVLWTVEKLYTYVYHTKVSMSLPEILQIQQKLPIRSLQDLAIRGTDLVEWTNKKPGKWIGSYLTMIEQAVLQGDCDNHKQAIKEWLIHDGYIKG